MSTVKTIQQVNFADIFHFAEKYGVGWNEANDLFFNDPLQYTSVTNVYGGDECLQYTSFWDDDDKTTLADFTTEEITAMEDGGDKAHLIIGKFLAEHNITEEVQVDCR